MNQEPAGKKDLDLVKAELRGAIGAVGEDVTTQKEDVVVLKKDVVELKQDVGVLKKDVAILKEDVGILKQDVAILKQDVGVLKKDVAILKDDVGILKQDVKEVKGEIKIVKKDIENLAVQVTRNQIDFIEYKEENSQKLDTILNSIDGLAKLVTNGRVEKAATESAFRRHDGKLEDHETRIGALEKKTA